MEKIVTEQEQNNNSSYILFLRVIPPFSDLFLKIPYLKDKKRSSKIVGCAWYLLTYKNYIFISRNRIYDGCMWPKMQEVLAYHSAADFVTF